MRKTDDPITIQDTVEVMKKQELADKLRQIVNLLPKKTQPLEKADISQVPTRINYKKPKERVLDYSAMNKKPDESKIPVLDYKEINKIKTKASSAPIDYSKFPKNEGDDLPMWKKRMMNKSEMGDDDSHMAASDLKAISHHIQEILENFNPEGDMPDWLDSKITVAAQNLAAVAHHLDANSQEEELAKSDMGLAGILLRCKEILERGAEPQYLKGYHPALLGALEKGDEESEYIKGAHPRLLQGLSKDKKIILD